MQNKYLIFPKAYEVAMYDGDIDPLRPEEVLVKIAYSSISNGTERANITGEANVSVLDYNTEAVFPRFGGYSASGTVVAVGENVTDVKVGDRVAAAWTSHARYCTLHASKVRKLEGENVSMQSAALCHIGAFSMAAIRKCRPEAGESAIVMGLGPLGLIAVQLLRAVGIYPVIAADPLPEKRALARTLGADLVLDPLEKSFASRVTEATHGGVNIAIEVTGVGAALDAVLDCMAQMGRVALLGCTRNSDVQIDYYHKVHGKGVSLIGAHTNARPKSESYPFHFTTMDDITTLLRLEAGGRINLSAIVAETHSPKDAKEVYDRLMHEKGFPVVQFDWREFK